VQVARIGGELKNHVQMIDIYHKLKQRGIKEKLYLVGPVQEDGPKVIERVKELELENDVIFLGPKDNPYPYMKHAKLFIHTARDEGLPTVLIESMACNTPVVAMDCPTGPKDILKDGEYGVLVPLFDEDTFVEKTFELLNDEEKYQQYKARLPQACERFDLPQIEQQFFSLLDQYLKS